MTTETNEQRIERLERMVAYLAHGILSHEYSKDLSRHGIEAVIREIACEGVESADFVAKQLKDC